MRPLSNGVVLPVEDSLDTVDSVVDGIRRVHLTLSNIYQVEIIGDQLPAWAVLRYAKSQDGGNGSTCNDFVVGSGIMELALIDGFGPFFRDIDQRRINWSKIPFGHIAKHVSQR